MIKNQQFRETITSPYYLDSDRIRALIKESEDFMEGLSVLSVNEFICFGQYVISIWYEI